MWTMRKIYHATRTVTLNKEYPAEGIYIVSVVFCFCICLDYMLMLGRMSFSSSLPWIATIRYRRWWRTTRARPWFDNIYTSARNGGDSIKHIVCSLVTHTFHHVYDRFGILSFCRTYIHPRIPLAIESASCGRLWSCSITSSAFLKCSLYTLSMQVSHSKLHCYTRGKIAEISKSRVTFANYNETATDELLGFRSSQSSYNPSKLNIWSGTEWRRLI